MTYTITTATGRNYATNSAKSAARVAKAWENDGMQPHAFAVGRDSADRVATEEVPISTVQHTATALVAAGRTLAAR